jgi:hypothetical protein
MGNLNFCNSFFYVSVIYETTRQPIVIFFVCIGEASGRNFSVLSGFFLVILLVHFFAKIRNANISDHQTNLVVLYYICSLTDDVIKDPLFDKGQFIPEVVSRLSWAMTISFIHLSFKKIKCNVFKVLTKNIVTKGKKRVNLLLYQVKK